MLPSGFLGSTVWIALDARDTKLAVGRELTESNLLSALGKEKFRRPFLFTSDRRRISPDPESGQVILITQDPEAETSG